MIDDPVEGDHVPREDQHGIHLQAPGKVWVDYAAIVTALAAIATLILTVVLVVFPR